MLVWLLCWAVHLTAVPYVAILLLQWRASWKLVPLLVMLWVPYGPAGPSWLPSKGRPSRHERRCQRNECPCMLPWRWRCVLMLCVAWKTCSCLYGSLNESIDLLHWNRNPSISLRNHGMVFLRNNYQSWISQEIEFDFLQES